MYQTTTETERRTARAHAGAHSSCPVEVIPGAVAPRLVGETAHYETRAGTRISHPSAYSRKGWSSMIYCPSTICVEVGAIWLDRRAAARAA